jgi:hypothetical protein
VPPLWSTYIGEGETLGKPFNKRGGEKKKEKKPENST